METSTKWALGIGAGLVGLLLWERSSGASASPHVVVPPLPPRAAWPDYRNVSLASFAKAVGAYNTATQQYRTFNKSDVIMYSPLENKGLAVAGIAGYVFYANDNGQVAQYWTPDNWAASPLAPVL